MSDLLPRVSPACIILRLISEMRLRASLAQSFLQVVACLHNRPIHEVRRRIFPMGIVCVKSYNVPQNSSTAATMKLYRRW